MVSYTLLSRPIIASWGNLTITGWGMLIGGLVLFLFTKAWNVLDLTAWTVIAAIVLIGTAVGFSVFLESVQYIGPVKSTLIGCLEPVSSMVFSVAALKTQISWAEWIGFALILCTVFLSVSEKRTADGCVTDGVAADNALAASFYLPCTGSEPIQR